MDKDYSIMHEANMELRKELDNEAAVEEMVLAEIPEEKKENVLAVISYDIVEEENLVGDVTQLVSQAREITIKNEQDNKKAVSYGKILKDKINTVKDFFKPSKDAANQAHKSICAMEKSMLEPLENAQYRIKHMLSDYQMELERERRRIEAEAQKRIKEEADRLLAEASKNNDEEALEQAINAEEMSETFTVNKGGNVKGMIAVIDYDIEVINENKVPVSVNGAVIRPVDTMAIKKLVKALDGNLKIDGIKITETKNIRFR